MDDLSLIDKVLRFTDCFMQTAMTTILLLLIIVLCILVMCLMLPFWIIGKIVCIDKITRSKKYDVFD